MKHWIRAIAAFAAVLLVGWVSGLNIERGVNQGFTLLSALFLALCIYHMPLD